MATSQRYLVSVLKILIADTKINRNRLNVSVFILHIFQLVKKRNLNRVLY